MKKIDFENFKVIFDNVKINGFRKFLSAFIQPLFSYNLKKPASKFVRGSTRTTKNIDVADQTDRSVESLIGKVRCRFNIGV